MLGKNYNTLEWTISTLEKNYCTYSVSGDIWNIFIHSTLKLNLLCYGKQRSKGQLNHMIHTFQRNFTCILSYSRFPTSVLNIFDWRPTVDKPRGQVNLLFEDVLSCLLARCSFLAPALKINKCYFFQANGFSAVK